MTLIAVVIIAGILVFLGWAAVKMFEKDPYKRNNTGSRVKDEMQIDKFIRKDGNDADS